MRALGDPDPHQQRHPLPAAAQRRDGQFAQILWRFEFVEHRADAPGVVLAPRRRQGAPHRLQKRQRQQGGRNVLFHMADAKAARKRDDPGIRRRGSGDAAQQGGFAAAIGRDQADPVARAEAKREVLEKRTRRDNADVEQADE